MFKPAPFAIKSAVAKVIRWYKNISNTKVDVKQKGTKKGGKKNCFLYTRKHTKQSFMKMFTLDGVFQKHRFLQKAVEKAMLV